MTTKDSSRRQIIIFISSDNSSKFITASSLYIADLNKAFKNIKLDIIADFVQSN